MGACATKPKDLIGEAPEAAPENVPSAEVAVKGEEEVASKDMAEEVKKEVEGGSDDDADRRRSLSNLFKEGKQVKEEASQITQASGLSEAKPEEVEKLVDAPVMSKIEKALEVVSIAAEAPKGETSEEKKIEKVKSETKTPDEKKVEEVIPLEVVSITAEAPKVETSEEKKIEEAKSETKTPDEKKVELVIPEVASPAEKKIEEAPAAPKSGAHVETKAEEKDVIEEKKSS